MRENQQNISPKKLLDGCARKLVVAPAHSELFERSGRFESVVTIRGERRRVQPPLSLPRRIADIRRSTPISTSPEKRSGMADSLRESIVSLGRSINLSPSLSLRLSVVVAIFFGAGLTLAVSSNFGSSALAREKASVALTESSERQAESIPETPAVLGEGDSEESTRFVDEVASDLETLRVAEEKHEFERKIRSMVAGYPIEKMVPYILEKDRIVAAFLVGIAKKESAWGKRVPLLREQDCFNYWGYRGKRRFMGTGGHTCFNSPKDAVDTVSRRLEKLIRSEKVDTPAEMMVVWKCGYDCSGHSPADTKKWIQDVDLYFHQLDEE